MIQRFYSLCFFSRILQMKLNNYIYTMGNLTNLGNTGQVAKSHEQLIRKESPVGIVSLTVLGVHINDKPELTQPNLKVRISNQFYTAYNPPIISIPQSIPPETGGVVFQYVINSFYKAQGRSVEVGLFSKEELFIYGAFDANVILEHKEPQEIRCILTNKLMEKGYVLIRASFEPRPYIDFNFRFETATIRRKISPQDYVAIRMTIGQQVLQTEFQKDTVERPPIWEDKSYNFKVPQGVLTGVIQLMSLKDIVIARTEINLLELSKIKEGLEVIQSLDLFVLQKTAQIVVADLKYSFILGNKTVFAPRSEKFTSAITGVRTMYEGEFMGQQHQAH